MTFTSMTALFGAMVLLAAIPGVSVMAVSARSAASGFAHGAATTLGIVLGDLVFIMLAVFGLVLFVEAMGDWFFLVKYVAGAYLLWLGVQLWRSRTNNVTRGGVERASLWSSFMAGLLITLADQKAVFFYLALFPAFIDLVELSWVDVSLVGAITIVAVGGVKLGYAYAADRAVTLFGSGMATKMNSIAAAVMVLTGVLILAST